MNFSQFKNKYIIKGELIVENALHIGSGKVEGDFDSAFIKTGENGYYIPGSSFKGYLRSKVEGLLVGAPFGLKVGMDILNEGDVLGIFGYTSSDISKDDKIKERLNRILGKDFKNFASKIHISDLPIIIKDDIKEVTRDGIKISRKTGATVKGAKFDYNVIEKGNRFDLEITLENIEDYQLEIIMLGLKDILSGDLFGGKLSRGIGKCRLELKTCNFVDSKDKESLKNYIFKGNLKNKDINTLNKITKISL
ncbi:CRISPR-associated protein, Csx7 family [Cetobacterium ceti]|uniref:CRISPR-associated protein, Csx7 family n=1 Tax=Cetobacterium ceti TaxID=180163 RepID=A0A1T4NQF9_9FUSO|nr:RAMP superfamily CRISPR-associated protein [Cetobacterium ceti]SJZ81423.1 CRISPR-associated protein, Csx7 family [Cetobacterium ceti]